MSNLKLTIISVLLIILVSLLNLLDTCREKQMHALAVKESLDIQESRDHELKLAEYIKVLNYEVGVLTQVVKDKK